MNFLVTVKERKGLLFTLGNRISLKANFQPGRAPHIIIVTGSPTLPGQDLNPGPLSLDERAILIGLTRLRFKIFNRDKIRGHKYQTTSHLLPISVKPEPPVREILSISLI